MTFRPRVIVWRWEHTDYKAREGGNQLSLLCRGGYIKDYVVVRFQGCHLRTFWNSLGCTTGQNNSSPGPLCKQRRLIPPLNSCSQHCQRTFSILKSARAHYCTTGVVCEPQLEVTQPVPPNLSHTFTKTSTKPNQWKKPSLDLWWRNFYALYFYVRYLKNLHLALKICFSFTWSLRSLPERSNRSLKGAVKQ